MSSPDMNLPIPSVSITDGPQWATDINSCLTIIDSHDHSAGYGVQITPSGININSDLPLNQNNLVSARSLRLTIQTATLNLATDLNCLNDVNGDLYFNDGAGNKVRITQSGAVAGSPGSISNLVAPASAAYVSVGSTFVWQSAANTPANMDAASYIFRNLVANSKGLTMSPPAAMGSDYSLILPSLPASQKFMTLDASGNMSAPWAVDNSTLEINSNTLRVKGSGINTAQIADFSITQEKLAPVVIPITSSSGSFSTAVDADVTNLSQAFTCTGRPVKIEFVSSNSSTGASIGVSSSSQTPACSFRILRDGTQIAKYNLAVRATGASGPITLTNIPPACLNFTDIGPSVGSHTYKLRVEVGIGTVTVTEVKMIVYEL